MKKLIFILGATWLLSGCISKLKEENKQLAIQLDSLQIVIEENKSLIRLLAEIEQYMDSIDILRQGIQLDLETGLSKDDDYVFRMKNLTEYVRKTELAIQKLSNSNQANISRINQLRREISIRDEAIANLQSNITLYKQRNAQINDQISMAESELLEIKNELLEKTNEFNFEQSEFLDKIQILEAESLFALGEGKEELARHMQFARKKKKQVLHDALDYYKSSNELGYEPALDRIKFLNEKYKMN